jgi:hypothetical protein
MQCALSVHVFQAKNKITVIPYLMCSPSLALCDLFLFQKLRVVLKRRRFNHITMIQAKCWTHLPSFKRCTSLNALNGGTITGSSQGDYFEEASIDYKAGIVME